MSVTDVLSRMQQIQTQLVQLGLAPARAGASTSAASFATALDGATATTGPSAATAVSGTTTGTTTGAGGVTGDDVLGAALRYQGTPYVLGGESRSGIDCSGLVQASFKDLGVAVPRLVHEQQTIGQEVGSLKDAKPGDLIVLNGGDHIAIYAGDGKVVHAPYAGRTVSLQKAWFDDADIVTIRRVVPATGDAAVAGAAGAAGASATAGTSSALSAATAGATGVSDATTARAAAMLGMSGMSGMSGTGSGSSAAGASLTGLLSSFGVSGASPASSSTVQQLLAAQASLTGASA